MSSNLFTRVVVNTIVPIGVIAGGVVAAKSIIADRPETQVQERVEEPTLVEVLTAQSEEGLPIVLAQGTVVPSRQLSVVSEVSGRIVRMHPEITVGGLVPEGAELFSIDSATYRINVAERETELATARANLEIERGRQAVAQREWEIFREALGSEGASGDLATRAPQMATVQTAIDAAEVRLRRARLDLNRTSIRAPFDAIVLNETAEEGLLVAPAGSLATLVATDQYWVQASVPVDDLPSLAIPEFNAEQGSPVTIVQNYGSRQFRRQGEILRLLPEMDTVGRLARVLVSVSDPLLVSPESEELRQQGQVPLLLGTYVELEFAAVHGQNVVRLPRTVVKDGHNVWVMGDDGRLQVRAIEIAWREENDVLISDGIRAGESVVSSHVETAVDGMALRTMTETPAAEVDNE
jgi:RND family efflux transporter MFP subunit